MKVLCIDGNRERLNALKQQVERAFPFATVDAESDGENACYLAERRGYDAVLTETQWSNGNGLKVARYIHDTSPSTKVIFVTEQEKYALPAFQTRACGYLLSPVSEERLKEEFADLNISDGGKKRLVEAKTFGNFELLCDGKAVKFTRSKTKELIAYLIDRRGTSASASELIVNLWEDKNVDKTTRSMFHNLVSEAKKLFAELGISYVLDFKYNSFRIDDTKIVCDYYELLDGNKKAYNQFTGEYMASYSWAEMTAGILSEMTGRY